MAFTYKWSDLWLIALKNVRNLPTSDVDYRYCDLVSSKMAACASWRPLATTIAPTTLLLQDGVQDYSVPANFYRLKTARLTNTSSSPIQEIELDVRDSLASNLIPQSPLGISNISHQMGEGVLRLDQAVQIDEVSFTIAAGAAVRSSGSVVTIITPTPHSYIVGQTVVISGMTDATMNMTKPVISVPDDTSFTYQSVGADGASGGGTVSSGGWEIRGSYDFNPTKITATTQPCWFDDKYAEVAIAGLTYWTFLLGGDSRVGNSVTDAQGRVSYTGQLGVFYAKLQEMRAAEQLQDEKAMFPSECLSLGRDGSWSSVGFWGN